MRNQQKLLSASLALCLGAAACTSSADPSTEENVDLGSNELTLTGGLRRATSCDELLNEFRAIGQDHVSAYGFGDGYWGDFRPVAEAIGDTLDSAESTTDMVTSATSDMSGGGEGSSFSGTNNQEANVDEADLVKTDGSRLVTSLGNKVRVFDVTGDAPQLTSTITLGENVGGGEIFLNGDRAYLMTSRWSDTPLLSDLDISGYGGAQTAQLVELDLVAGTVLRTVDIDGSYVSARQVGDTIRIVLSSTTQNFAFVYPSNKGAEESALKANQDLLANSTIDMWLPSYRITEAGTVIDDGRLIDCTRMYLPEEFSGFGTVSVVTIDTNEGLTPDAVGADSSIGVMSSGETVYSSTDRLTIATARWPDVSADEEPENDPDYTTAIHSFDITDPTTTNYVASGSIPGHLLNQYALSEYEGNLRVAATEGALWWNDESSASSVFVLAEDGNELKIIGSVGDLGKGEQIFAVRFMGDRGYVVTFRQTDPLYVIDLADPTNPTMTGELKIPGYSAYLHPIPGDRLLGVGQDGTEDGQTTGSAVSLFDISDPSNPTRIEVLPLGNDTYSSVEYDAKAFTWWEPTSTSYIPITWWSWNEETNTDNSGSASVAVAVGSDGLTEMGRISHPSAAYCENGEDMIVEPVPLESDTPNDDAEASLVEPEPSTVEPSTVEPSEDEYCWSEPSEVRRTIIIGDKVYTVSAAGLMVNALDSLERLSWTEFTS